MLSPSIAIASDRDEVTRERTWWAFHGDEYWRLFFPNKTPKSASTIERDDKVQVLTIKPSDRPVTIGLYGGKRDNELRLLNQQRSLTLDYQLASSIAIEMEITLRDEAGEKALLVSRTLEPGANTVTWNFPSDIERWYHSEGGVSNEAFDGGAHLFNAKFDRLASTEASELRLIEGRVIEVIPATEGLSLTVRTPLGAPIILTSERDEAELVVVNESSKPKTVDLSFAITEEDGSTVSQDARLDVPAASGAETPGEAAIPLTIGLDRYGVKTLSATLNVEGDAIEEVMRIGRMTAAGNASTGAVVGDDMFEFAIGGMHDELDWRLAALMGAEGIRMGGNWSHREPQPGVWKWDSIDEQIDWCEQHGLIPHYLTAYGNRWAVREPYRTRFEGKNWPLLSSPPEMEPWLNWVRTLAERYDGRLTRFEIWNEPDLEGFWRGTTDEYIDLLRQTHATLKSVNPDIEVMTGGFATALPHGGQNLNPDMQLRVIRDAQDAFDIHTHHQHGRFEGFRRAVDGQLAEWRSHLKTDVPLYFNETGLSLRHSDGMIDQANHLAKKIAFAFARGADGYAVFVLRGKRPGEISGYAIIDRDRQPRPAYVMYNEIAKQLRGLDAIDQLQSDTGRMLLHFGRGDRHTIVGWHEELDTPNTSLLVRVPDDARAIVTDLYGNERPADRIASLVSFAPGAQVQYLNITNAETIEIVPPVLRIESDAIAAISGEPVRVPLVVSNPSQHSAQGSVTFSIDGGAMDDGERITLAPGASVVVDRVFQGLPEGELTVTVEAAGITQSSIVPLVRSRRLASGTSAGSEPTFRLDSRSSIVNYNENDPNREHLTWQGPSDLSAEAWFVATAEGLRGVILVTDDVHEQTRSPGRIWQADSVQLAVSQPMVSGHWEFGLALHEDGTEVVRPFVRPAGAFVKDAEAVQLTTKRDGSVTSYDVLVPWHLFRNSERPDVLSLNFVVNDSDEGQREGLIRVAPGIDSDKRTDEFPSFSTR
ncbi:MAG: hypothetical protein AAGI46_04000 [Planctomycetota bacterium]